MATATQVQMTITAKDNASRALKNVSNSMNSFGKTSGSTGRIISGVFTSALNTAKTGLLAMGAAMTGVAVLSMKTGISFEKTMSSVAAKSQATGEELKKLEMRAREMAEGTVFSATESASAMDFMAMAGLNVTEIIEGLPGVLNLAQAGNLDLATSADIATNIMSQFGIEAENINRVVDVMATTVTSSNTDITEMGEAMKFLGPTMKALGVTLEETSAVVGVLANNGIKGSLAGRAFGTSLTRLAKPTKQMSGVMKNLNLDFFDAEGQFMGMVPMVKMLEDRFAGLTSEQKQAAIATLFGAESLQEVNILLETGSEELAKYQNSLENSSGAGEKMADTMTNNVWGSLKRIGSAFEEVQLKIYDQIKGNKSLQGSLDKVAGKIKK